MKTATRIIAALIAVIMVFTTVGCSGGPLIAAKYQEGDFSIEVPTGVYISYLLYSYSQAEVKVPDYTKGIFHKSQEIDGKPTKQWIIDNTVSMVKQHVYLNKMYKELDFEVPQDEIDNMTNYIEEYWIESSQFDVYSDNGVSKESLIKYFTTIDFYYSELFNALYGKGGSKEVSEKELKDLFDEKYMRIKLMSARLYNSKDEKLSDSQIEDIRSTLQGYVDRINKGEDFDKVFKDYDLWNEERVFKLEKPDEKFEPAEREEDKDTSKMTPEELEEYISDKGIELILSRDEKGNNIPPAIFEKLNSLPVGGKAELWTNDEYYFVLQRFDMNERQTLFDRYYETLLWGYKGQEYQDYLKNEAEKLNVEIDELVIKKNSPKKLVIPTEAE